MLHLRPYYICLGRTYALTLYSGPSTEKTARHLPARLHCQERRNPLHTLLRQEPVPDFHGSLRLGRPKDPAEA